MSLRVYWIPLILLGLLAPFTPWLDLHLAGFFFAHQDSALMPYYLFIFNYLAYASWLVLAVAVYWVISGKKRKAGLYLMSCMVIGSGLLVHLVLKDHWGRPRPRQTIEFGGEAEFRPFYKPNFSDKAWMYKSFPCGHCSVGFWFFSLMVLGKRLQRKRMYAVGMVCALIFGALFGMGRIGQGGHFFSDVLVAAAIMWWTAWALDWLFFELERKKN